MGDKLTELAIKKAKPAEKVYRMFDGGGLHIEVHPSGKKFWRMKFNFVGKERRAGLGEWPDVSLAAARDVRDDYRRKLRDGINPIAQKKQDRLLAAHAAANTFEIVAREWHSKQTNWTAKHQAQVIESLEADVFPDLGDRPISQITSPELLATLRKIEARGALEIVRRVRQRCSVVFRYAIATGRATSDPAAALVDSFQPPPQKHMAALPREEFGELLRAIRDYDGATQTRLALELLALTFVRTVELRQARWDEFDLEGETPCWNIPAARMKTRLPHWVPLAPQAVALLRELRELNGDRALLFPNERKPDQPISENTVLYAIYRMGYHSRMTGHGFRAVASTILNECGYRPDVIERQLAHTQKNKVRAAYNRAEYREERIQLMNAWADMVDAMRRGAKVTPIKRAA